MRLSRRAAADANLVLPRRFAECGDLSPLSEAREGASLDLTHAFAREPELAPNLLERLGIGIAVHPVAELHDLSFSVGQGVDGLSNGTLGERQMHFL
jgi:hypothetical protein